MRKGNSMHAKRGVALIVLSVLVMALVTMSGNLTGPPVVLADPNADLEIFADYPSIVVEPGKTVSLAMRLVNRGKVGYQTDLSIAKAPEGWQAVIKEVVQSFGSSTYVIRSIYVGPGETKTVSFEAVPPEGVKLAGYSFVIKAESKDGLNQTVTLNVEVAQRVVGGTKMVAQYPEQQGRGGTLFEYKADVTNGTGQEQSYSLSANTPEGWAVSFQPAYDTKQISSLRVKAGETSGLNIQVTPARNAPAGEYPIEVLIAAGSERITGRLKLVLTGTFEMKVATATGRLNLNATSGSQEPFSILVNNTGSEALKDIDFSSSKPSGWEIAFDPKTVSSLASGATREVNLWITPDEKALAGDYSITLYISNPQTSKQVELRVTVETSTLWGWVGIGLIVLVLAGLFGVFRALGRR